MISLLLLSLLTAAQTKTTKPEASKADGSPKVIYCAFGSVDPEIKDKFTHFEVRDRTEFLVTKAGKISSFADAVANKTPDQLNAYLGHSVLILALTDGKLFVALKDFVETPKGIKTRAMSSVIVRAGLYDQTFHAHKFQLFCMPTPVG